MCVCVCIKGARVCVRGCMYVYKGIGKYKKGVYVWVGVSPCEGSIPSTPIGRSAALIIEMAQGGCGAVWHTQ